MGDDATSDAVTYSSLTELEIIRLEAAKATPPVPTGPEVKKFEDERDDQVAQIIRERNDLDDLTDLDDGVRSPVDRRRLMASRPADRTAEPVVSLAKALDEIETFITRFVRFPDPQHQPVAVTLWVAHTYAIDAAENTPYLQISAPEKRSGKSRLLEVLEVLAYGPVMTNSISPAALFRVIDELSSTMLIDEYDNLLGRNAGESGGDLRAILNAGHRRGAKVHRTVPVGRDFKLKSFEVFGAKALAGIGDLPDTIADRCIPIRLQRQPPHDQAEKFRRDQRGEAELIALDLGNWMKLRIDDLRYARPSVPAALNDRLADGWEPLIAIADAAGESWPANARAAAVALAGTDDIDSVSTGQTLLTDIRVIFDRGGSNLIATTDGPAIWTAALIEGLHGLEESPWGDWDIKARRVARILRGFEVKPRNVRRGETVKRGYRRRDFEETWVRYISPTSPASTTSTTSQYPLGFSVADGAPVADVVDVVDHREHPHGDDLPLNVEGEGEDPGPLEEDEALDLSEPSFAIVGFPTIESVDGDGRTGRD